MKTEHAQFAGSVPENYDRYMGPLFFEPYAEDLAQRADKYNAKNILEIACGTGRVTRHLLKYLSPDATLIATDLNEGMIAVAKQQLHNTGVQFAVADAQQLPFDDAGFDIVVCQFGFMFMPDKQQAFNETYRVLKSGSKLIFNTWNSLAHNQLTLTIKNCVAEYIDKEAADFYNVPFSFYDGQKITQLLQHAGFKDIRIDVVTKEGTHVTPDEAARGLILGTPAFNIISAKNSNALAGLIEKAAKEVATRFGNDVVKTELNALVCEATK